MRRRDNRAHNWHGRLLVVVIGLCWAPLAGAQETSATSEPATARPLTGRSIADRVMAEFRADPVISMDHIGVVVVDGEVTISGSAPSLDVKQRAERIAEGVRGVKAVRNKVRVRAEAPHTDRQLTLYVEEALEGDPATRAFDIEATAQRGIVTLTGSVSTLAEKQLASEIAGDIFAVREVRNRLGVTAPQEPADPAKARNDIVSALRWDARVDASDVEVRVDEGTAVLEGRVTSAAERRRAIEDASVQGVTAVNADKLVVDPLRERGGVVARPAAPPLKAKPDAALKAALEHSFENDPRLDDADVRIEIDSSGVVTLRGAVDSLKAKRTATELSRNLLGVKAVRNRLRVDPSVVVAEIAPSGELPKGQPGANGDSESGEPGRDDVARPGAANVEPPAQQPIDDAKLVKAVRAAIRRDPYLSTTPIDVDVVGGEVYLDGQVQSVFEKMRADDVAARTLGVTAIHNELDIAGEPTAATTRRPYVDDDPSYLYEWYVKAPLASGKSDEQIRADLREQLFWSPFVDEDDVRASVQDGFVKLEGSVGSWAEHDAATDNAYEAGALWVDNNLEVEGG